MKLEQIDGELADLRATLGRVGDDLLELTQVITYQRLAGEGGWPQVALTGATAARVAPALETLRALWERSALVSQVIARAAELRGSVSRLVPAQKTLDDIAHLLSGPSIEMPCDGHPASGARSVTPGVLLEEMTRSFQGAREAVLAVDAAWDRLLPALAAWEGAADAIQQKAVALDEPAPVELTDARRQIELLRTAVEHDPLSAEDRSAAITPRLEAASARLDELGRERDRAGETRATARQLFEALKEAHGRAVRAYADREAKVRVDGEAPFPRPRLESDVTALGAWLARLEVAFIAGKWKPALIGLRKWSALAAQHLAEAETTRAANDAPLLARRDLRGLLDALKAKARGLGRAEDTELDEIAQNAWRLLNTRPTPLDEARRLVADYQSRLL